MSHERTSTGAGKEHDEANYQVLNIGGSKGYTVLESARIL